MYNMVNIIDNTLLYNWNLLREEHLNVFTNKKKKKKEEEVNMWGDKCVNWFVGGTLSQCIHVSNHRIVLFKYLIISFVNSISIQLKNIIYFI